MDDTPFLEAIRRFLESYCPTVAPLVTDDYILTIRDEMIEKGYLLRSGEQVFSTPKGHQRFEELKLRLDGREN